MGEPGLTPAVALADDEALHLLRHGEVQVEGRLVDASNATLYCAVSCDGLTAACVYKPVAGERPLWDFPDGTLAGREVAAYELSAHSGWRIVPPTVYRDGPAGPGMVQLWIETDPDADLLSLIRSADSVGLARIAVFDAVINNADRKGGHLLPSAAGHVYGVDHGVSFHVEDKLRTVLWQWAGDPLPAPAVDVLVELRAALDRELGAALRGLVNAREVRQTARRVDRLLALGRYPEPGEDWPAIPWPPL